MILRKNILQMQLFQVFEFYLGPIELIESFVAEVFLIVLFSCPFIDEMKLKVCLILILLT